MKKVLTEKLSLIILMISLLFPACGSLHQTHTTLQQSADKFFLESDSFAISSRPILNREYLIFLTWYIMVYGDSYPEKVLSIIPGATQQGEDSFVEDFTLFLNNPNSFIYQYILNPKYLDYPLMGLSKSQALEMGKWLQDRYNENVLFEAGLVNFNMAQKDEDCFSTEAYLVDQYVGSIRNNGKLAWADNKWVPRFRLPYAEEYEMLAGERKPAEFFKAYSFGNKDFLWLWSENLLKINKAKEEISLLLHKPIILKSSSTFVPEPSQIQVAFSTNRETEFQDFQYMDLMEEKEKDYYGQMHFEIVGEDTAGKALVAKPMLSGENKLLNNDLFWMTFNKIIPDQYLFR